MGHAPPKRSFIGRHSMFGITNGTLPNGGAGPRLHRRSVLLGSAALLAASFGPVQAAEADPFAAFMAQSHLITGHDQLDEALGRRIHDRFREQDPAFDARLAVLAGFLARQPVDTAGLQASLDAAGSDAAPLPRQLARAWFTGVVGEGAGARCVTYAGALMNLLVADILRPPSYAYGPYGSWSKSPV
jgi:hypothetical protein